MLDNYPDILTAREVQEILFIGKNKFYELVNHGELPAVRIGKQWRIAKTVLITFLQTTHT